MELPGYDEGIVNLAIYFDALHKWCKRGILRNWDGLVVCDNPSIKSPRTDWFGRRGDRTQPTEFRSPGSVARS